MSDFAIRVENLGKRFFLDHNPRADLRQTFQDTVKSVFKWSRSSRREEYWALRDLNFEVKRGDVIGIVGKNGAGKSTLLKILSRITGPTTGRFEIEGRVSSLLEVGTGFHSELTGRENIFLNGTILGMRRAEIKRKLDEIIAFSGVENFLDTPVKHYSSGMRVRLAFSVAAHLEPEILIIDEVLAVGDSEFQKKCLGKMDEVSRKEGRTILFVSHNLVAIEGLCRMAILLQNGRISDIGSSHEIVRKYQQLSENREEDLSKRPSAGTKKVKFERVEFFANDLKLSSDKGYFQVPFRSNLEIVLDIKKAQGVKHPVYFAITILDFNRVKVLTLDNFYTSDGIYLNDEDATKVVCTTEALPLNPGYYTVDLWCADGYETFQKIEGACGIEIVEHDLYGTGRMHSKEMHGYLNIHNKWTLPALKR